MKTLKVCMNFLACICVRVRFHNTTVRVYIRDSEAHLSGFLEKHDELKDAGAELIACVSVNDP